MTRRPRSMKIGSDAPGQQNIPVRTELGREIRRAFTAPEGVGCGADYSKTEERVQTAIDRERVEGERYAKENGQAFIEQYNAQLGMLITTHADADAEEALAHLRERFWGRDWKKG